MKVSVFPPFLKYDPFRSRDEWTAVDGGGRLGDFPTAKEGLAALGIEGDAPVGVPIEVGGCLFWETSPPTCSDVDTDLAKVVQAIRSLPGPPALPIFKLPLVEAA